MNDLCIFVKTHSEQKKRPKTLLIMENSKIAIFQQFLDVFSAQGDRINLWSFACYQAS